ncbi:MAG: efflux transporter outer membrane subunit [Burkholderiales bacterium]|nr:efflux transporter outer membrane subunit [Burkholderiales bacterium]
MLATLTLSLASAALLTLGGCASHAGIETRASAITPAAAGIAASAPAAPALAADWWRGFGDPALDALVERALADQPSLKVAAARVERARAAVAVAQSADGPHLNGSASIDRERLSGTAIYPPPLGGTLMTLPEVKLSGNWEFDFFGRNRAAIAAAVGQVRAAEADRAAARNLLAAGVARGYLQLARLVDQREVASATQRQRQQVLALIRERVGAGLDTHIELRQGEGALPENRQQIEALGEQIMLQRHALAALTAQPPAALDALAPRLAALHPVALPAAIPADLLGRRADIAAARERVAAAAGEVDAAKAQFYPNIDLGGFLGLTSVGLDRLLRANSREFAFGPAISLPIFDGGRLRANLRGRSADYDAAVESYNGSVIDAVHEVADAIGSLRSIESQRAEQARAQQAVASTYDLAQQRYRAGLSNYLTVLGAESSVLAQRRLDVDLRARAIESQIALMRSLGGGYVAAGGKPAGAEIASAAAH